MFLKETVDDPTWVQSTIVRRYGMFWLFCSNGGELTITTTLHVLFVCYVCTLQQHKQARSREMSRRPSTNQLTLDIDLHFSATEKQYREIREKFETNNYIGLTCQKATETRLYHIHQSQVNPHLLVLKPWSACATTNQYWVYDFTW